jgi:hypothetical protein
MLPLAVGLRGGVENSCYPADQSRLRVDLRLFAGGWGAPVAAVCQVVSGLVGRAGN